MCARSAAQGKVPAEGGIPPTQGELRGDMKNGRQATVTSARPAFRRHEAHAEGSDTTPHTEMPKKCKTGTFITAPNRAPAKTQQSGFGGKRTSDRESESCRLRRDEGFVVRSDDGQHRICLVCGEAAALPNAPGGAWPHTPFSGRSPDPLLATIGENHEKRYQIQHAHGVR